MSHEPRLDPGAQSTKPMDTHPSPAHLPEAGLPCGERLTTGSFGRFHIRQFHVKGGLGEVYVAEDDELRRTVAFKRIRPEKAADVELRRRFLLEAEITAKLEHPGIVPVYGLVHGADGQPYYAMRFIEGESLKEALERYHANLKRRPDSAENRLSFRGLLQSFVTACKTMAYAHSRGVIHRDLKPQNIMLGKFGETLLVDWGMAKAAGVRGQESEASDMGALHVVATMAADEETRAGQAKGTPEYMSPEQARGRLEAVGPASDIFSLGAILYALVTGRAPMQGEDAYSVLDHAKAGNFAAPRRVKADVPKPLEAICLKAMARDLSQRYATATDLAADVEHWLADEPVAAYREPVAARLWRWMRRHRASTFAGGVVIVAATAALLLVNEANRRAELERARAWAATLTEISEQELLNIPGLQSLRLKFLERAEQSYSAFLVAHKNEPELDVIAARLRIAQIKTEFGLYRDAYAWFLKAIDDLEKLQLDQVDLQRLQSLTIGVFRGRLRLPANAWDLPLDFSGEAPTVIALADRALAIWTRLVQRFPEVPGFQNDLAGLHTILGVMHRDGRNYDAAMRSFQQADEIWDRLVQCYPDNGNYVSDLVTTRAHIVEVLFRQGKIQEAIVLRRKTLEMQDGLCRRHPDVPHFEYDRAGGWHDIARLCEAAQQEMDAIEAFTQAQRGYEALLAEYPTAAMYRQNLAHALAHRAKLRNSPADTWEAALQYARCLPFLDREFPEANPEREDRKAFCAGESVRLLRETAAGGYRNVEQLKNHADLKPLRGREDYQKLLRELEESK